MATFWEIAARSVNYLFSLYFVNLLCLFTSRFGFESGICLLIAPVPVHCFSITFKERQNKLPTLYWLPKLHKRPYKARFIANSSSCTTSELSKLLTSSDGFSSLSLHTFNFSWLGPELFRLLLDLLGFNW